MLGTTKSKKEWKLLHFQSEYYAFFVFSSLSLSLTLLCSIKISVTVNRNEWCRVAFSFMAKIDIQWDGISEWACHTFLSSKSNRNLLLFLPCSGRNFIANEIEWCERNCFAFVVSKSFTAQLLRFDRKSSVATKYKH